MNRYNCKVCDRVVYSAGVTFTGGNLVINLPAGAYNNGEKYCIIITDIIPAAVTREAPVFITIGGGAVLYPFNNCCGVQLTQESVFSRHRYPVRVRTNATSGSFNWLENGFCWPVSRLASIDGTAPAAEGGA